MSEKDESAPGVSAELAALIGTALRMSDALQLHEVGISLNNALLTLSGKGVPPPAMSDLDAKKRA